MNLMNSVYNAINLVLLVFEWALIIRVLMTWLPVSKNNKFVDLLYAVTEPVLGPIRNMLSKSSFMNNSMFSMFDFSPIVAFILISVVRNVIRSLFYMFLL